MGGPDILGGRGSSDCASDDKPPPLGKSDCYSYCLHCFETASSVLRVKALNFNWSRTSTVGTVDSLCITRIAPLDTTWCTASGSPIEPEGLPCNTSHWVLLCTRLLIMDSVLSSLE